MPRRPTLHCELLEDRIVPALNVEQVANINRVGSGEIRGFHNVDGTLVFSANDGTHGSEIWTSSPAGVQLVRDIRLGMDPSQTSIADGTVANGVLYFTANDGVTGFETWRTDGTSSGTLSLIHI